MKILSFGEIIWDIYSDSKAIGGAPFNFAAHASLCEDDAYLLSAVGDDELGNEALSEAADIGINCAYITVSSEKSTGTCAVTLNESGVPAFDVAEDTAYDSLTVNPDVVKEGFDLFAYGTLALRTEKNKKLFSDLIASGVAEKTFLDLNLRVPFYTLETVIFALERANILKMNEDELSYIAKELTKTDANDLCLTLKELSRLFKDLETVIVTYGAFGSYGYDCKSGELISCSARKVKAVSTVGAGDCFSAVFLSHLYKGEDMYSCLKAASDRSALVVESEKAIPDGMKIRSAFLNITEDLSEKYDGISHAHAQIYLGDTFSRLDGGVWTPYLLKTDGDIVYIADADGVLSLAFYTSQVNEPEFIMENGNLWLKVSLDEESLTVGMSKKEWLSRVGQSLLSSIEKDKEIVGKKHFEKCMGKFSWLYRILHL